MNKKAIVLKTQLFLAENPEATPEEIFEAGYKQAAEDFKKKQKEKEKKELALAKQEDDMFAPKFEDWWEIYSHKVDRAKCEKLWYKLSTPEKEACIAHTPQYVASTPDIQYRRYPETYLRNKSWNNPIIQKDNGNANEQEREFFTEQAELFARLNATRKPNT